MNDKMKNSLRSRTIDFNRNFLDPATPISCLGTGELGGKAEGLVYIRDILHSDLDHSKFADIKIEIPSMAILCTDVFDSFMKRNNLFDIAYTDLPDDRMAYAFQNSELPFEVLGDLRSIVEQVHLPLAIRSSSMLEDTKKEPFAGIYHTKMIPNNEYDPDTRFRQLIEAIKFVYASTYFKAAKAYRKTIGHNDNNEKMAVIIQEIIGKRYRTRFYPEVAGVARSYNYYPMRPAKPEDGVVNLALGLGKTVVDGGISWAYSPTFPKAEPPFMSSPDMLVDTQTEFWVVNMGEPPKYDPINEGEYITLENIVAAEEDSSLKYVASTYIALSGRLSIGTGFKGPRVLTFAPLLLLNQVPFNDLIKSLLTVCEQSLGTPVEIEFAMTFNPHRFGFLQVRAMAVPTDVVHVTEAEMEAENVLISSNSVLGNGVVENIKDIVYVKPESFALNDSRAIVPDLELFNDRLLSAGLPYMLIVFGRLGTADPWLGIPVQWGQICGAKVIVEATLANVRVELSQGAHYFHNMINLGIKYFSLPFSEQHKIDWNWFSNQELIDETHFVRHIRLKDPLKIRVDGRRSRGVICKPKSDK
jgi:Pyruvate phosphate dikinase, AMP/ATP-binding domain